METIKELKDKFIADTLSVIKDFNNFSSLSEKQFNWKPSPKIWSIAECIEHLRVTNKLYIVEFEKQFSLKQLATDCSKEQVKHKLFGKLIIKYVDPDNLKKVSTFPVFTPSKSNYTKDTLNSFIDLQNRFIRLISSTKDLDFNKYKMSSPASKLIKENFCDVIEIVRLHDRRHFLQAKKNTEHTNFPKE